MLKKIGFLGLLVAMLSVNSVYGETAVAANPEVKPTIITVTVTKNVDGTLVGISESIDYSFILDSAAVGEWKAVNFVQQKESFNPANISWKSDPFLKGLNFYDDGTLVETFESNDNIINWTSGFVIKYDTIPGYEIQTTGDKQYMFYQWKSGDYTIRGSAPWYYVFEKVSDIPVAKQASLHD